MELPVRLEEHITATMARCDAVPISPTDVARLRAARLKERTWWQRLTGFVPRCHCGRPAVGLMTMFGRACYWCEQHWPHF